MNEYWQCMYLSHTRNLWFLTCIVAFVKIFLLKNKNNDDHDDDDDNDGDAVGVGSTKILIGNQLIR